MLISVVIPTCNRNDLLSKCLDLLAPKNQTIGDHYEIVVTDDSRDSIAKDLIGESYPWVKWIAGPQKGPAANRNNGAKNTKGEWVVFIDDDCLPDKGVLNTYKNAIVEYKGSLAFEGSIIPDDWSLMKKDMSECPINTDGNCFWSANICVEKQLFTEIGGFDESFILAAQEDQDLFVRLRKHTSVIFLAKCVVIHPVRFVSLRKKLGLVKKSTENWYLFAKKENSFSSCFSKGLKSQVKALINNIKAGKVKSTIYHIYNLFVFTPIMIRLKIMRNE
jgi:GT2 family glycosyltransferase